MPRSSNFCAAYPAEPLLVLAAIIPRRPGPQKPGWEASTCAASAHFGDVASCALFGPDARAPRCLFVGVKRTSLKNAPRTAFVKVFGGRPQDGGAAHSGAGVRKPPMEETAMGTYGAAQLKGFDGCHA